MKIILLLLLLNFSLLANIGTIMVAKGSSILKSLDGKEVSVTSGLSLSQGDTILTQKKSRVQVMLLDETVVTVGSNSKFSFDEYAFDGKKSKVTMSASRGFFRSVTGKIGKLAPQRFKVKTSSATIGIRGTDFWGITGGETETVTCNKGAITIEYNGKMIKVDAGSYAKYGPKGVVQGKIEKSDTSDSTGVKEISDEEEKLNIPTEDIADITQAEELSQDGEPFSITSSSEDREQQY